MSPAIQLCSLSFNYPDGTPALIDVTLRMEAGECVALLGPNGSGKSTLLHHLNGLLPERLPAAGGAVLIEGIPVTPDSIGSIRKRAGLLFQDPDDQLFCGTVKEDVAFGPEQLQIPQPATDVIVHDALNKVGLLDLAHRPPHHLSTGEKRRACLAGVLACSPGILVLDEPTSGLDPRGRRELMALLRTIPATKLIATHDLELVVELCPRSVILDKGRVIADGPTVELLNDESLMVAHGLERPHILQHRHPHAQ